MKETKYILTDETIKVEGRTLHRIQALKSFADVKEGDLGGYVESRKNLSQYGNCWIYNDAKVYGNAKVYDDAEICDLAEVCGDTHIFNSARIYGFSRVYGEAVVSHYAQVYGNAIVFEKARVRDFASVFGSAAVHGGAELKNRIEICAGADIYSNDHFTVIDKIFSPLDNLTFFRRYNGILYCVCNFINHYGFRQEVFGDVKEVKKELRKELSKHPLIAHRYIKIINTVHKSHKRRHK